MLGIKSYTPKFYSSVSELQDMFSKRLIKLKGKELSELWVVWEKNDNEWFKNCPVIIRFEDIQVELCANKFDEYSITFNTIDMKDDIDWFGMVEFDLIWKNDAFAEFVDLRGKELIGIEFIEYSFETKMKFSKENPNEVGKKSIGWLLNGLGFYFESSFLSVTNGLDENMIEFSKDDSIKMRYTEVGSTQDST